MPVSGLWGLGAGYRETETACYRLTLQAVLDDNLVMVRLLTQHGAKINKKDEDGWTPLHAAAANGLHLIAK